MKILIYLIFILLILFVLVEIMILLIFMLVSVIILFNLEKSFLSYCFGYNNDIPTMVYINLEHQLNLQNKTAEILRGFFDSEVVGIIED